MYRYYSHTLAMILSFSACTACSGQVKYAQTAPPAPAGALADWEKNYAHVYDEWFAYMQEHAQQVRTATAPQYRDILMRYAWAVNDKWLLEGKFRFVVVDEQGELVPDARPTTLEPVGTDWRHMEPKLQSGALRPLNGEHVIPFNSSGIGLELVVNAPGYRSVHLDLPREGFEDGRLRTLFEMLTTGGYLRPPRTPDGPVEIVLDHKGKWNPPLDSTDDGVLILLRPPYPDKISEDCPTIISTDQPETKLLPKLAAYALVDRDGKPRIIMGMPKGFPVFFRKGQPYANTPQGVWIAMYGSGGFHLAVEKAPWRWVLFSEPVPLIPATTQPATAKSLR